MRVEGERVTPHINDLLYKGKTRVPSLYMVVAIRWAAWHELGMSLKVRLQTTGKDRERVRYLIQRDPPSPRRGRAVR